MQICLEFKIHTLIEEKIFYPAFRGKIEDDNFDEAYVEHDGAKLLINDNSTAAPEDNFYDAKVKVLSEEIIHHVHEEEMSSECMFLPNAAIPMSIWWCCATKWPPGNKIR